MQLFTVFAIYMNVYVYFGYKCSLCSHDEVDFFTYSLIFLAMRLLIRRKFGCRKLAKKIGFYFISFLCRIIFTLAFSYLLEKSSKMRTNVRARMYTHNSCYRIESKIQDGICYFFSRVQHTTTTNMHTQVFASSIAINSCYFLI